MSIIDENGNGPSFSPADQKLSLKHTSTRSAIWMGLSSLLTQFLTMATTAVLAHILAPSAFGLLAMAMISINLASLIAEMGLASALIQRKDLDARHLSSAFWANLAVNSGLAVLALVGAPLAAVFFAEPLVSPIVMALGLSFLLSSIGTIHIALLQKQMAFKALSIIQVVAQLVYSIVVILLALWGQGVWALVWGVLVQTLVSAVLPWFVCSWRPKLVFDRWAFRDLFGFGANLMGLRIVLYLRNNIGNAAVGKALGVSPLGFYNLAYNLSFIPGNRLAAVLNKVLFPAFSSIQVEDDKLRAGYLQAVKYVTTVTFPISVGIIVIAPELIKVVYGSRWLPALVPLQILGLGGIFNALPALSGGVIEAKGRPDLELKMAVASFPVFLALMLVGLRYDLVGAACATSVSKLMFVVIGVILACAVIKLPAGAYLSAISHSTVASAVMGLAVLGWRMIALHSLGLSDLLVLLSSAALGVGAYFLAFWVLGDNVLVEMVQLCWVSMRPRAKGALTTSPS